MRRRTMRYRTLKKIEYGFSLIEMIIAVAILLVVATILTPLSSNTISFVKLRYSTAGLGGLIQKARIEAARKNTYYSIAQTSLSGGVVAYFVDLDKSNSYSGGDPVAAMGSEINVHAGTGSGAPGESAFAASLNFAVDGSGALPNFNARGLPCLPSGATCPQIPGQGFIYFLSRNNVVGTNWAAVAVTPSGRVTMWSYNGNNWSQL